MLILESPDRPGPGFLFCPVVGRSAPVCGVVTHRDLIIAFRCGVPLSTVSVGFTPLAEADSGGAVGGSGSI
jgi:hypothetical protein